MLKWINDELETSTEISLFHSIDCARSVFPLARSGVNHTTPGRQCDTRVIPVSATCTHSRVVRSAGSAGTADRDVIPAGYCSSVVCASPGVDHFRKGRASNQLFKDFAAATERERPRGSA